MTRKKPIGVLKTEFFRRPAKKVAEELLGKFLVKRAASGKITAEMITEVEIYDGPNDKASHACRAGANGRRRASRGKTIRTAPMFEAGGIFYVYLCYGMYYMLNVVTSDKDYPAAILIRATELTSGPGRITKKFGINKRLNGLPATREIGLWFEDRGVVIPKNQIFRAPRTRVDYAGKVWAGKKFKYVLSAKY